VIASLYEWDDGNIVPFRFERALCLVLGAALHWTSTDGFSCYSPEFPWSALRWGVTLTLPSPVFKW